MIIVGAKGFAKEVLEIFYQNGSLSDIAFYDDIDPNVAPFLYDKYPVLKNDDQIQGFFKKFGFEFTLGVGNPLVRFRLFNKFKKLGGTFTSCVSPFAKIGHFDVNIGCGCNILDSSIISNGVKIGDGCIIYYHSMVTHDCRIGDFVEISPGATILGRCQLGSFIQIGANATVLPDINIGNNVIVGAGSIVTKDVPDNCLVVGAPAMVKKYFQEPNF